MSGGNDRVTPEGGEADFELAEGVEYDPVAQLQKRTGGVVSGRRAELRRRANALVETAGDTIRAELARDDVARTYARVIREGVADRDRTCIIAYGQIMKLLGAEKMLVVNFVNGLGVNSETELRRMLDVAKSVEGIGPHDGAERCVAYLEAYFNAFPEQRGAALRRLGGYVPV